MREARDIKATLADYQTLELNPGATKKQIRKQYLALSRHTHPDKVDQKNVSAVAQATEKFKCLTASYDRCFHDKSMGESPNNNHFSSYSSSPPPEDEKLSPLFNAIKQKDLAKVKLFVERGDSLSEEIEHDSPLGYAIQIEDYSIIIYLFDLCKQQKITEDLSGRTPLLRALEQNRIEPILTLLEDTDADIYDPHTNAAGQTALDLLIKNAGIILGRFVETNPRFLHYCAENGKLDYLQKILSSCEFGGFCGMGYAKITEALHSAVENGHVDIAKLFIEHGADPYSKDKKGQGLLEKATAKNNQQMLDYLSPLYSVETQEYKSIPNDTSRFHQAIREGDLGTVKLLIAAGVRYSITDKNSQSGLQIAVTENKTDLVGYLEKLTAPKKPQANENQANLDPIEPQLRPQANPVTWGKVGFFIGGATFLTGTIGLPLGFTKQPDATYEAFEKMHLDKMVDLFANSSAARLVAGISAGVLLLIVAYGIYRLNKDNKIDAVSEVEGENLEPGDGNHYRRFSSSSNSSGSEAA
jgi:ankyrin repeat protein